MWCYALTPSQTEHWHDRIHQEHFEGGTRQRRLYNTVQSVLMQRVDHDSKDVKLNASEFNHETILEEDSEPENTARYNQRNTSGPSHERPTFSKARQCKTTGSDVSRMDSSVPDDIFVPLPPLLPVRPREAKTQKKTKETRVLGREAAPQDVACDLDTVLLPTGLGHDEDDAISGEGYDSDDLLAFEDSSEASLENDKSYRSRRRADPGWHEKSLKSHTFGLKPGSKPRTLMIHTRRGMGLMQSHEKPLKEKSSISIPRPEHERSHERALPRGPRDNHGKPMRNVRARNSNSTTPQRNIATLEHLRMSRHDSVRTSPPAQLSGAFGARSYAERLGDPAPSAAQRAEVSTPGLLKQGLQPIGMRQAKPMSHNSAPVPRILSPQGPSSQRASMRYRDLSDHTEDSEDSKDSHVDLDEEYEDQSHLHQPGRHEDSEIENILSMLTSLDKDEIQALEVMAQT